nr:hypothetical protein [Tanacetum cinerariifolium]
MSKVKCYNFKNEGHFAKDCKKAKVKDYEYYKTNMLLAKKDKDEQVLLAEDQAWMESSSDSDQEISANMVFMAQIEKALLDSEDSSSSADEKIYEVSYYLSESESESEYENSEYYDNTTNYGLFVNDNDDQEIFHECENIPENLIESQMNHNDKSKEKVVVSSDSEGRKADDFNELKKITALLAKAFNRRKFYSKPTNNNLRTSSTSQSANKKQEFVKSDDKQAVKNANEKKRDVSRVKCYKCKKEGHFAKDCKKVKVKDYEYYKTKMLLAKKDKDEQVLLAEDQASSSSADEKISEKRIKKANQQSKDFENQNKDLQDKYDVLKNQANTFEMNNKELNEQLKELIEKNNDLLAQTKKQIADQEVLYDKMSVQLVELDKHGFENPSYFKKAKDLRPTLYDEKVIGLGYTLMFLTHSDEALKIEKFKRSRENKFEFAYDYGNLNASYVNEKINFEDDYFQEIINLNFEKIDFPFQQTSSLKPYVSNVILEKIIIDLEDEVVSLLEKEKANLETIESLKSKSFELSENVSSESENQTENDCLVVEKEYDKEENPKLKRKRHLDTFSSVRRPKNSGVIWKKKWSSNSSNVGLSAVSVLNLNKNVKQYSGKDLLACNNSHLGETSSTLVCNDAMNVSCNSRMDDLLDDNNFFIFDDVNVRISQQDAF